MMRGLTATELLAAARLTPHGPVIWGDPVPCRGPGVYVVETATLLRAAPIDERAVRAWLSRVPTLRLDGRRPSPADLAARLAEFWIADDRVTYVGRTGSGLAKRVGDFYRTPLGDPRPHLGGHWLKTLAGLDTFRVWWAETDDPSAMEDALLTAFARRHGGGMVLPFANRQTAAGVRKLHGITGSTLSRTNTPSPARERPPRPEPRSTTTGRRIAEINAALQRLACAEPGGQIRAVDAARELERLGLLGDSGSRRGLPLRKLLRDGQIEHACQEAGWWWFVRCAERG